MAEVLVLVDHVEGEIKKATYELLTAARALGEPSAVVVGPAVPVKELAAHGAEKVYVAETEALSGTNVNASRITTCREIGRASCRERVYSNV